jgi:hypothetical protein
LGRESAILGGRLPILPPAPYDFGDGWEHEIVFEGIEDQVQKKKYPLCLAGSRACPPEDCGGTWGYEELLETLRNPSHEEYESMLEWLGGSYDPEAFDSTKVRFTSPKKRWKAAFAGDCVEGDRSD